MRRQLFVATWSVLLAGSVAAATLDELVEQTEGSRTCWQRIYDAEHLASHPDQQVTAMTFGAGFFPQEVAEPDDDGLTVFGMDVTLRDGTRGTTSGICWPDEDGTLRCGVECDGGGVNLSVRDDGNLLIDLEAGGYIRMESECGGGDGETSFPLEPGLDDRQFLLHASDVAICDAIMPDWQ